MQTGKIHAPNKNYDFLSNSMILKMKILTQQDVLKVFIWNRETVPCIFKFSISLWLWLFWWRKNMAIYQYSCHSSFGGIFLIYIFISFLLKIFFFFWCWCLIEICNWDLAKHYSLFSVSKKSWDFFGQSVWLPKKKCFTKAVLQFIEGEKYFSVGF